MAVNVTIKSKGIIKKEFKINDILLEEMRYGIMDEAYRLEEGKIGKYTVIFMPNHICRGYEITLQKGEINLRMPLPTSLKDIEFFYEYIQKLCKKMHTKEFIREEEKVTFDQIPDLIKMDVKASEDALKQIKEDLNNGKYEVMYLFGVRNPITIGKKEIIKINEKVDNLGHLMHSLQSIDAYYAKPKVYKKQDDTLFGVYVLTENVKSIFPYEAKLFMADKNMNIENWYLSFIVDEKIAGSIPYQEFIKSIKEKEEYDTEHFIISLNKEEIYPLIEKYKVNL